MPPPARSAAALARTVAAIRRRLGRRHAFQPAQQLLLGHHIDHAVARYRAERLPGLKAGDNTSRELEATRDWWAGRHIDELAAVCAEYAADQAGALAPATIAHRIAYLRAACRYGWRRHNMGDSDPGARVISPPVRNARDVTITRAQILSFAPWMALTGGPEAQAPRRT